ncbi:MAG: hypothetical protein JST54_33565 [Deltaproteobacteria bacterium]|nr:hypothetical protein [Deltaproteobacteria bacterium]
MVAALPRLSTMRVRFTHGAAEWPTHTRFHAFRVRLASAAGLDLESMEGFGGSERWRSVRDAIAPLLELSEPDGELAPLLYAPVGRRLRELIPALPEGDQASAVELANGLMQAAHERRRFGFRPGD